MAGPQFRVDRGATFADGARAVRTGGRTPTTDSAPLGGRDSVDVGPGDVDVIETAGAAATAHRPRPHRAGEVTDDLRAF